MTAKTFRAPTMLEALQQVQHELGTDAIVLSMREVPSGPLWQAWRKPACEVVAASRQDFINGHNDDAAIKHDLAQTGDVEKQMADDAVERILSALQKNGVIQNPVQAGRDAPANPVAVPSVKQSDYEVRAIKPEAEDLIGAPLKEDSQIPPALAKIKKQLTAQGLDRSLIRKLITNTVQVVNPQVLNTPDRLQAYLQRQLEAGIKSQNQPMMIPPSRVMCMIGTSGSGKTSLCAKLASHYSLTVGKQVVWVSADTFRMAGISEARTYADAIGVKLRTVYTPEDLREVLKEEQSADLVLVDMPGSNPFDEDEVAEIGGFLAELPAQSLYLVAAATTKESDLAQFVASYGPFRIRGLMITKADETYTFGDAYNLAWRSQLPIFFYTNGHQAVGNLLSGEVDKLVGALFGKGMK